MKQWEQALDQLCEGCRDMHPEWIHHQAKIIKDFIATTEEYVKQVEQDYDEYVGKDHD